MPAFLLPFIGFLKRVPWQVWAVIGILAAGYIYGEVRFNAGKQVVIERLKEAEREAERKSIEALKSADAEAKERSAEFGQEQETLEKAIENAESTGSNPLDGLFDSLP